VRAPAFSFIRDAVDGAPEGDLALVELARDGSRREWTFGDMAEASRASSGAFAARGVGRGDVVMTLVGSRPEWVVAMLAGFRLGAVVLPCSEQLRPKDLALRLGVTEPVLVVCDERNADALAAAGRRDGVLLVPGPELTAGEPVPGVQPAAEEPCLITVTSGTAGEPKAVVHAQRYLAGQRLQAEHWLDPAPGRLVWCTAASGWSKSARNAFIAPWIRGAPALLHDARFDPEERLEVLARERVDVLCMAPTEYRGWRWTSSTGSWSSTPRACRRSSAATSARARRRGCGGPVTA
jgi:acetyl-CoA synthetase